MYWESKRRIDQKKYYMTLSINYLTNQEKRRRISLEHIIYYNIPQWLGLTRLVVNPFQWVVCLIHTTRYSQRLQCPNTIHNNTMWMCIPTSSVVQIMSSTDTKLKRRRRWWRTRKILYNVQSLPAMPCTRVDTRKEKIFKFLNCSFLTTVLPSIFNRHVMTMQFFFVGMARRIYDVYITENRSIRTSKL